MKRVLITGANSYVGTHVEDWLKKYPNEFEVDTVGTKDGEWKKVDFSKYDAVYDVAGIAHVDAKKKMEPLYRAVNTDLTIAIAKKAKESGVKQFIFMSSSIVYHESRSLKPIVITKDTKPDPNNFYGDSKLQAEIGINALNDSKFKVVVLRPPMIYGPGCKGNFMRLAKLGTVTPIFPAYHNKRSMLYIDNLSELVRQIILREECGLFHPDNAEYADTVEIIKAFAKRSNRKVRVWKWLNAFVHIGSPFVNSLNKMFGDSYFDKELSKTDFDYQVVSLQESLTYIDPKSGSLKGLK